MLGKLLRKKKIERELELLTFNHQTFTKIVEETEKYLKRETKEDVEVGTVSGNYAEVTIGDETYVLNEGKLEIL